MRIGVITAIPQEFEAFGKLLNHKRGLKSGWTSGVIESVDVVLATCGIGKVNAASVATALIERHSPTVLFFSGVAGGLDPSLSVGDVVIGALTIQHDAGVIGPHGFEVHQAGHVPFFNPADHLGYRPSDALLERCQRRLEGFELKGLEDKDTRITFGTILTGDQFLANTKERGHLFAQFEAQAIEMEGAAVAQVAERYGVDHLIIRSLSDLAGAESILDFQDFLHHVATNAALTLKRLVPAMIEGV